MKIIKWLKRLFKIHSPSEVCKRELEPIVTLYALKFLKYSEPIVKGFEDSMKEVKQNE